MRTFAKRAGTGEKKGCKRMAETGCVFDVVPPEAAADAGAGHGPGSRPVAGDGPRAVNRWYTCDITASRAETIATLFDQAGRRDPGHARPWIALVDGDNHQIDVLRAEAARQDVTITIMIDFIHVLEYLWKAAWCFHPPRDPAMEDWVTAQGLDILHGRAGEVISRIAPARRGPPAPARQRARQDHPQDPALPARPSSPAWIIPAPWRTAGPSPPASSRAPAATSSQDRMGITGARWGLQGAQAMLWLRAIAASGDHDAYWAWHITQEHHRNHLQPLPGPRQPRTRRITLTPKELHPCDIVLGYDPPRSS